MMGYHKELNNLLLVKKSSSNFIHMTSHPEFKPLYNSDYQSVLINEAKLDATLDSIKLEQMVLFEKQFDLMLMEKPQGFDNVLQKNQTESILNPKLLPTMPNKDMIKQLDVIGDP
ncbi:hypothetical protein [Grimontia sp. NTOU-MAR1]|uniref:hypothetical protein n=1 Tax=Grimontia sp. NTOU-MAR1 TaxID=3111011 RepID=UPI002DBB09EF|nr:hypothetical protein [Grimontia sp. NTOU-MAR1]WRV98366.1 hypothetical protein VP504_02715 [Grimontia sp. NTOU-MAR1]